ncbi:MAG TPA: hypothetical protein PLR64_02460 [Candidatus Dojkabacteria bacterium]|nr:hypothetical protein [Candidatus Dojkabacteria bacterium]
MKVTVYSTKGQQKYEHVSTATTWGALKEELFGLFDFSSLNATENITRRDLSVDTATLPEQDFVLFLRPKDTKSGSYLPYGEAKAIIKKDKNLQEAIKIAYATDYTHLSTGQMNEAIQRFSDVKGEEDEEGEDYTEEEEEIGEIVDKFLKEHFSDKCIAKVYVKITYSKPQSNSLTEEELELQRLQKEADEIFNA